MTQKIKKAIYDYSFAIFSGFLIYLLISRIFLYGLIIYFEKKEDLNIKFKNFSFNFLSHSAHLDQVFVNKNNNQYSLKNLTINVSLWPFSLKMTSPETTCILKHNKKMTFNRLNIFYSNDTSHFSSSFIFNTPKNYIYGDLTYQGYRKNSSPWNGILTANIDTQESFGIFLGPSTISAEHQNDSLLIKNQKLTTSHQGSLIINGNIDLKNELFSLEANISNLPAQDILPIADDLQSNFNGSLSIDGNYLKDPTWTGSLNLNSQEGSLISFNPVKIIKSINAGQKLFNWTPIKQGKDGDIFLFNESMIKISIKDMLLSVDQLKITRSPDHYLTAYGEINIDDDNWNLRVKYFYPGNLVGLGFNLSGNKDAINFKILAKDVLRLIPNIVIPNLNNE